MFLLSRQLNTWALSVFAKKVAGGQEMFGLDELQGLLDKLVVAQFFTSTPSDGDVALAGRRRKQSRSAYFQRLHNNAPVHRSPRSVFVRWSTGGTGD